MGRGESITPHRVIVEVGEAVGGEEPWDGRSFSREKGRSRRRASRGAQRGRGLATDHERVKRDGRGAFALHACTGETMRRRKPRRGRSVIGTLNVA